MSRVHDKNINKYANSGCLIIFLLLISFFAVMLVFGDFFVKEEGAVGVPTLRSALYYGSVKTMFAIIAGIIVIVLANTFVKLESISRAKGILLFAAVLLWMAFNAILPLIFAIIYLNPINEIKRLVVYYMPFILFFTISGIGLWKFRLWGRIVIFWLYPLFMVHYVNYNYGNPIGVLWHVVIYSSLLFYLTRPKIREQFT